MERRKGLNVMFMNAQSVCNKMNELRVLVACETPDIVAICETWTNETHGDAFFTIDDYEIITRRDRNDTTGGRGGGILMYGRKELSVWTEPETTTFNQCVTVKVKCGGEDVKIHCVYRSPNSTRENDTELNEWLKGMRGTNVLVGDFNYPDVDWDSESSGARARDFLAAIVERGMEQHVEEATHLNGNILDLILTDGEGMISGVQMMGRLGKSDHEAIMFHMSIDAEKTTVQRPYLDYRRADYDQMRKALASEKWDDLGEMDVNGMWGRIKSKMQSLMREYAPTKRPKKRKNPPWMNRDLRKKIEEKRRAWKRWKETGRETDREEYRRKEKETKNMIRNRKNGWEKKILENRKQNPKLFYAQINRARKTRDKIAPLRDGDRTAFEPREKAETLNKYYAKVFTRSEVEPPRPRDKTTHRLEKIDITKEKVESVISLLKEDAAPGPDELPPRLIRELKDELSGPLTTLFRASMKAKKIPDEWREASITPIYKQKGSKADPGNYRPVSLTNVVGKLMERIVKNEMTEYVESNKLMSDSQHGFRSGRSVQTNMVEFLNTTTKWLDEGRSFDVIYLDFAKAFDKVCHRRLLVKLEEWGIIGEVLGWLEDWLRERRQRVRVDGEYSSYEDVLSSVLQGSVLGGILFNIYVDDIDEAIKDQILTAMAKFADDTKVAKVVETEEDEMEMQKIIDELARWAKKWEMSFNAEKCKVMHFGNHNRQAKYVMDGIELGLSTEERDLGIRVANTLKPSRQCAVAAKSANFALSQIQRSFHFRRKKDLIPLYKTFVRPKLEFGVAAWSPWTEADKKEMEKVQERLMRMVCDASGDTYEEKLNDAGLTTLKERRERGDAIEVFKTLRGVNNIDESKWFRRISKEARPLRSNTAVTNGEEVRRDVIEIEHAHLEVRRNFFVVRAAKVWNELPDEVRNQRTVNGFKNAYDAWGRRDKPKNTYESAVANADDQVEMR